VYTVVEERESLLDRYDRFLVRYGIPAVIGIFAVIIVWFALRGQETNAWMTFALFVFAMFLLISPIGISAARSPPWEK
jgi:hypothetical protein